MHQNNQFNEEIVMYLFLQDDPMSIEKDNAFIISINFVVQIAVVRQRLNKWCLDHAYSVQCDYGRPSKLSLKVYLSRLHSRPL